MKPMYKEISIDRFLRHNGAMQTVVEAVLSCLFKVTFVCTVARRILRRRERNGLDPNEVNCLFVSNRNCPASSLAEIYDVKIFLAFACRFLLFLSREIRFVSARCFQLKQTSRVASAGPGVHSQSSRVRSGPDWYSRPEPIHSAPLNK